MIRTNKVKPESLSSQMKKHLAKPVVKQSKEYDGNFNLIISTGSTLLDLAISGGRIRGGGIPGGILVEIFGPSGSGKTVLLSEIAGTVQRAGGEIMFHDPEARLNKQFAKLFDLDTDEMNYKTPDTVPEVFSSVRSWKPKSTSVINGIMADSLAALSTDLEMNNEEGDKMGSRRAKEFSQELRRTCRVITQKNYLMVCSNQIREDINAGQFGQRYRSPGGEAIGFYSSLRLRASKPSKIKKKLTIEGKETTRVIGVETEFEVFKSSIWKPYRTATVSILFDYGIDDIRDNLIFLKENNKTTMYCIGDLQLNKSLEKSIQMVESGKLEKKLKNAVIDLWEEIEKQFESERKPKER